MQFQRRILDIYSHSMPKQWRGIQTFKQNCLSIFISKTFIVELILTNPLYVVCFRTLKWRTYCSSISFSYSSYFEVGFIIWFLQHHTGETFIRRMVFMFISKHWSYICKKARRHYFFNEKTCEYICTFFLLILKYSMSYNSLGFGNKSMFLFHLIAICVRK